MTKQLKSWWMQIPAIGRNPFFLTALAFGVWMLFFDENNLLIQYTRYCDLKALKGKKAYYLHATTEAQRQYDELTTSPALQEKYAREHYLMKRDNEDVFVFVKK